MPKPIDLTRKWVPGQRMLPAADFNAIRDRVKGAQITVAAPLKIQYGGGKTALSLASGAVLPGGTKGEILVHNGTGWVAFDIPAFDAILYFDHAATGLPMWIPVTDNCPTTTTTTVATTTTTAAPTTTTSAPTTTTAAPTTTTAAATTTTSAPTTTTAAPTTTTSAPTTTTVAPTTTTPAPTTTTVAPTTTTPAPTTTTVAPTTTTAAPTTTTAAPTTTTAAATTTTAAATTTTCGTESFAHNLDSADTGLGDDKWTSRPTSGNGVLFEDEVWFMEGSASQRAFSESGAAGTAYGQKDLVTTFTTGECVHFHGHLMVNKDVTPGSSPEDPEIDSASYIRIMYLHTGGGFGFRLEITGTEGSTTGNTFRIRNSYDTNPSTVDGIDPATWTTVDLYCYIHDTEGTLSLYFDDVRVIDQYGVDTYGNAVINELGAGFVLKNNNNDVAAIWWDAISLDDCCDPNPTTTTT